MLWRAVEAHPDIETWSEAFLVDLLTEGDGGPCRGALVHTRGRLRVVWAGAVVLASGGYAQVYRESTNVPGATGDALMDLSDQLSRTYFSHVQVARAFGFGS